MKEMIGTRVSYAIRDDQYVRAGDLIHNRCIVRDLHHAVNARSEVALLKAIVAEVEGVPPEHVHITRIEPDEGVFVYNARRPGGQMMDIEKARRALDGLVGNDFWTSVTIKALVGIASEALDALDAANARYDLSVEERGAQVARVSRLEAELLEVAKAAANNVIAQDTDATDALALKAK